MSDQANRERAKNDRAGKDAKGKDRLLSPVFIVILLSTLCMFLVGQGANAGTSVYVERTGGSAAFAGIGALCFSVAAGLSRIFSGTLIDSRGRKIVMVAGSLIMLAGTIGPLLINQDAFFILWRILQGAGFSAATTATATAAADVLPLSRMGEGIGYYGLGQAVSMSIGPALAIFLVSTNPPENLYIGLSLCSALSLIMVCFIRYERCPSRLPETSEYFIRSKEDVIGKDALDKRLADEKGHLHGLRRVLDNVFEPSALPGTIPILLMCAAFSFNIFYIGMFGYSIGIGNPGMFYTFAAVVMISVRLISGRFMDKVPPLRIMLASTVSGIIAFAILLICSFGISEGATNVLFCVAGIPFGLCMGIAIPINQTVAVRLSPSERWGAANALFMFGVDVGNGIFSLAWGLISESLGFGVVICAVIACLAAAYLAAYIVYPRQDCPKG